MNVLAYDKFPSEGLENGDTVRYVELDELLKNSDIIFDIEGFNDDKSINTPR